MKYVYLFVLGIIVIFAAYRYSTTQTSIQNQNSNPSAIRYIPVGDSYTEGLGVRKADTWPEVLTTHIQSNGHDFTLIKNLGVTGYTASDVIKYELPEFERLNPDLSTLLIGANDISLGISSQEFHNNLITILNRMLSVLPDKNRLIIMTIPDFTKTPSGQENFIGEEYAKPLKQINEIIRSEANKRELTLVELENIPTEIGSDTTYYTGDGLHPSARQYLLWEKRIFPSVLRIIEQIP